METTTNNSTWFTMKHMLALILFGVLFLIGMIGFYTQPSEVKRSYNHYTFTDDDEKIYFDIFEPKKTDSTKKNAVIIGHGIIVNKEVMKLLALELARAGFVAVTFDFRGHGRSSGDINPAGESFDFNHVLKGGDVLLAVSFNFLTKDIRAIKDYLKQRGDINMTNLGFAGYSMAGGAAFHQLNHDTDFQAFVGIAPQPELRRTDLTHPRNMLLLHAKYDEAIMYNSLTKVMEMRTGVPKDLIETDKLYGNFADGSAAKLYIDPVMEHFLAPWNWEFIRETRNWILKGLGVENYPETFIYPFLLVMLLFQMIGVFGLFFTVAGFLLNRFCIPAVSKVIPQEILDEYSILDLLRGVILFLIIFAFPCMVLMLPMLLTPMLFSSIEIMFIFGPAFAILLYLRNLFKKQGLDFKELYTRVFQTTNRINVFIGIGLGLFFYLLLNVSIGQVFSLIPGRQKLIWVPINFFLILFSLLSIAIFLQGIIQEKISGSGKTINQMLQAGFVNFILMVLTIIFVLIGSSLVIQNYFTLMFLIPTVFFFFTISLISTYIYSKSGDIIMVSIINAIFICTIFSTLSPTLSIWSFFK